MKRFHKLLIFIVLILTLAFLARMTGISENFTVSYIQGIFSSNIIISSFIFITFFCIANLLNIPGWIFLVASVLTLGKFAGGALTIVAAICSCIVSFIVVDYVGGDVLLEIKNKYIKKILSRLNESPIRSVIILRVFFQTFPPINYALALSGIKFREYLIGTLIGLPIPIITLLLFFDLLFKTYKNL